MKRSVPGQRNSVYSLRPARQLSVSRQSNNCSRPTSAPRRPVVSDHLSDTVPPASIMGTLLYANVSSPPSCMRPVLSKNSPKGTDSPKVHSKPSFIYFSSTDFAIVDRHRKPLTNPRPGIIPIDATFLYNLAFRSSARGNSDF